MERTPGQNPCSTCPTCGGGDASVLVPGRFGAYCECRACGHRWLDAQPPPPRGARPPELRRKGDRRKE